MTAHDAFFQDRQPAAVLKHAVLAEYTKVFASMVGSRDPSLPIWVIDGYAGSGAYETKDPELTNPDGSPLVVLKMAEGFSQRHIRCVFIEQDAAIASALRMNVAPFLERGSHATVLEGSVEQQLPTAWAHVHHGPVVTFLDPFGVAMDRRHMTDILLAPRAGNQPSEVLLNINLEAVWRIGGNLQRGPHGVEAKPGQEKGVVKVDTFLGGTWWREAFIGTREEDGSAAQAAQHVIDEYRRQVCTATGRKSMSIPIRRRPGQTPLFLLTLFFDHDAAGYKFADAACRATRRWRDVFRARELSDFLSSHEETLFDDEFLVDICEQEGKTQEAGLDESWISLICDNVRRSGKRRLALAADIEIILGETLGLAGERHIRKAWDRLAKDDHYLKPRDTKTNRAFHRAMMERA